MYAAAYKTPACITLPFLEQTPLAMNQLPDELILDIVSHLQLVQPSPSLLAQGLTDEVYTRDQAENQQRLSALAGLCLASKRLHRIATATLYSTLIIYAGSPDQCYRPACFLRTMIACPDLRQAVFSVHALTKSDWHFTYGDLESADIIVPEARRIVVKDGDFDKWQSLLGTSQTEACLVLMLAYTSNIRQLVWSPCPQNMTTVIELTMCGRCRESGENRSPFRNLSSMLLATSNHFQPLFGITRARFPSLRNMQLDGQMELKDNWYAVGNGRVEVKFLSSLRLIRTHLEYIQLPQIITPINSLEHLAFSTELMYLGHAHMLTNLHAALSKHHHCLKSLSLMADALHCSFTDAQQTYPQLYSLRDFSALTTLDLPSILLLGAPFAPPSQLISENLEVDKEAYWAETSPEYRISELLPPSLQQLMVRDHYELQRDSLVLEQLTEDCLRFPNLDWIRWRKNLCEDDGEDFVIF